MNKRRPHWTRLKELVEHAGRGGVRALSHKELQELGMLYRQTAADLAAVREDPYEEALARSLNQLLARGHNLLYAGRGHSGWGIWQFYSREYPRIFRQNFGYVAAAFFLFLMAGLMGALLTFRDPAFERFFLGPSMLETIHQHKMWTDSVLTIQPLAASGIMTNNIVVTLYAYVGGIVAGLGTIRAMLYNGLMIGVVGVACYEGGMSNLLWSFVAPHGVLELPAIFIGGGAGLMLARGLLFPGFLSRKESIAKAGRESVRLVLGIIPILIVAGTIEGFFSPTHLPSGLKYAFAAALFTIFAIYLGMAGRRPDVPGSSIART